MPAVVEVGWATAQSQEARLGHHYERQEPNYLNCCYCLPEYVAVGSWSQEPELSFRPKYSKKGAHYQISRLLG